jgi:transcription initiation factor IIF auxiliary subunit
LRGLRHREAALKAVRGGDLKIRQDEKYLGEDWWKWSVWIEGEDLTQVEKVIWKLHPTFPDPVREVVDAGTNFRLDTAGWGTFIVRADMFMRDGKRKPLTHDLELHYPDGILATA